MEANTRNAVKEAERLLAIRSYDSAHDLAHHKSVLLTALDIAKNISEELEPDILEIACMWHDVISKDYEVIDHKQVTHDTAEYLKQFMIKTGFAEDQANTASMAVRHHEFGDKPVNTEGKVLFDADKLDNLNLDRVRRFVASDKAGGVPRWKLKAYVKGGIAIIKLTRSKLHFGYSKQLFDKTVNDLWDDKEVAGYAEKYGVDLDDIKRALRRTTLLDRVAAFVKR